MLLTSHLLEVNIVEEEICVAIVGYVIRREYQQQA